MSVDGHMSTNDTVLLLANGAAGGEPLAGDELGRVPNRPGRSVRRSGQGHCRRRRRRHASGHDRSQRLRHAANRPGNRQDRGQQSAGEDGAARGRSELGAHRLGGGLCRRAVRSQRRYAAAQRVPALREGVAGRVRRPGGLPVDPRQSRHADSARVQRRHGPAAFLDGRPDGGIRAAQCGLPHFNASAGSYTCSCDSSNRPSSLPAETARLP